jgi:hypothetical protein
MKANTMMVILTLSALPLFSIKSFAQDGTSSGTGSREQARADSLQQVERIQKEQDEKRIADAKAERNDAKAKAKEAQRVEAEANAAARESKNALRAEKKAQKARDHANKQARKAELARQKSDQN